MTKFKVTVLATTERCYTFKSKDKETAEAKAKRLFTEYEGGKYDNVDVIEIVEVKK